MMFKIGDKVVSLKNIDLSYGCNKIIHINKYDIFTIDKIHLNYLYFNETNGVFKSDYFILLKEYRRIKLDKLTHV